MIEDEEEDEDDEMNTNSKRIHGGSNESDGNESR